jgi:hypothetical protein
MRARVRKQISFGRRNADRRCDPDGVPRTTTWSALEAVSVLWIWLGRTWGQWCDKLFMRRCVVSFTKFFAKGNGGIMRPIATAKARHDRYHQQTKAATNQPRDANSTCR